MANEFETIHGEATMEDTGALVASGETAEIENVESEVIEIPEAGEGVEAVAPVEGEETVEIETEAPAVEHKTLKDSGKIWTWKVVKEVHRKNDGSKLSGFKIGHGDWTAVVPVGQLARHPSELKIGDTLDLFTKVSLFDGEEHPSFKVSEKEAWLTLLKGADKLKGQVSAVAGYGVFVKVTHVQQDDVWTKFRDLPWLSALIHNSNICWRPEGKGLAVGDEVEFKIVNYTWKEPVRDVDPAKRRPGKWEVAASELEIPLSWVKEHLQTGEGVKTKALVTGQTQGFYLVRLVLGGMPITARLAKSEVDDPDKVRRYQTKYEVVIESLEEGVDERSPTHVYVTREGIEKTNRAKQATELAARRAARVAASPKGTSGGGSQGPAKDKKGKGKGKK